MPIYTSEQISGRSIFALSFISGKIFLEIPFKNIPIGICRAHHHAIIYRIQSCLSSMRQCENEMSNLKYLSHHKFISTTFYTEYVTEPLQIKGQHQTNKSSMKTVETISILVCVNHCEISAVIESVFIF